MDKLGRLVAQWMAQEGHSLTSAAKALGYETTGAFTATVCPWVRKRHGLGPRAIERLADGLSRHRAFGWSKERWRAELMARRDNPEWVDDRWGTIVAAIESDDPFVLDFKRKVLEVDRQYALAGKSLTEQEMLRTIRLRKGGAVATWLGLGNSVKRGALIRPQIDRLPGIARFYVGEQAPIQSWDAEIVRLSALIFGRHVSPAGAFVLRTLWECDHSIAWLRRHAYSVDDLVWEGQATELTLDRIASALQLGHAKQRELRTLLSTLLDPAAVRRKKHTARTKRRHAGGRTTAANAKASRQARYFPVFERFARRWPNLKERLIWRQIVAEARGTYPTADKAYQEWLQARYCQVT